MEIFYGILIVNEIVDEDEKRKNGLIMFKVDFEKAYDSMEWCYLDVVMTILNLLSKLQK